MHYVLRHFRCSYLKANKVSTSEKTRQVEYVYNFWKCAEATYPKVSKSVHAWRNHSLPKLARFFSDTVYISNEMLKWLDAMEWLYKCSCNKITLKNEQTHNKFLIWQKIAAKSRSSHGVQQFQSSYFNDTRYLCSSMTYETVTQPYPNTYK